MSMFRVSAADAGDFKGGRVAWDILKATAQHRVSDLESINLAKCVHLKPYAVACLAGLSLATGAECVEPEDCDCKSHLERFGFFQLVRGDSTEVPRSTSLPLRRLDRFDETFSDAASRLLVEQLDGELYAGFRRDLADALDEAIRNAVQHSESPVGCLVCGQAFPQSSAVEIAILDLGITIRTHLARSRRHAGIAQQSDREAIEHATQEGVTGTTGTDNSGAGLHFLRDLFESHPGQMTILSGDSILTFYRDWLESPSHHVLRHRFEGTLMNLRLEG